MQYDQISKMFVRCLLLKNHKEQILSEGGFMWGIYCKLMVQTVHVHLAVFSSWSVKKFITVESAILTKSEVPQGGK